MGNGNSVVPLQSDGQVDFKSIVPNIIDASAHRAAETIVNHELVAQKSIKSALEDAVRNVVLSGGKGRKGQIAPLISTKVQIPSSLATVIQNTVAKMSSNGEDAEKIVAKVMDLGLELAVREAVEKVDSLSQYEVYYKSITKHRATHVQEYSMSIVASLIESFRLEIFPAAEDGGKSITTSLEALVAGSLKLDNENDNNENSSNEEKEELIKSSSLSTEGEKIRTKLKNAEKEEEAVVIPDFGVEVMPYLFVSGLQIARSYKILRGLGITHIINCCSQISPCYFDKPDKDLSGVSKEICYLPLHLSDDIRAEQDISWIITDVIRFIEDCKDKGGKVLIHCENGQSKSCSVAAAYCMWLKDLAWRPAVNFVKTRIPLCNPSNQFICNLIDLEAIFKGQALTSPLIYRLANLNSGNNSNNNGITNINNTNNDQKCALKICRAVGTGTSIQSSYILPRMSMLHPKAVFVIISAAAVVEPCKSHNTTNADFDTLNNYIEVKSCDGRGRNRNNKHSRPISLGPVVYVWQGRNASPTSASIAVSLANKMIGILVNHSATVELIRDDEEPMELFEHVIDDGSYNTSSSRRGMVRYNDYHYYLERPSPDAYNPMASLSLYNNSISEKSSNNNNHHHKNDATTPSSSTSNNDTSIFRRQHNLGDKNDADADMDGIHMIGGGGSMHQKFNSSGSISSSSYSNKNKNKKQSVPLGANSLKGSFADNNNVNDSESINNLFVNSSSSLYQEEASIMLLGEGHEEQSIMDPDLAPVFTGRFRGGMDQDDENDENQVSLFEELEDEDATLRGGGLAAAKVAGMKMIGEKKDKLGQGPSLVDSRGLTVGFLDEDDFGAANEGTSATEVYANFESKTMYFDDLIKNGAGGGVQAEGSSSTRISSKGKDGNSRHNKNQQIPFLQEKMKCGASGGYNMIVKLVDPRKLVNKHHSNTLSGFGEGSIVDNELSSSLMPQFFSKTTGKEEGEPHMIGIPPTSSKAGGGGSNINRKLKHPNKKGSRIRKPGSIIANQSISSISNNKSQIDQGSFDDELSIVYINDNSIAIGNSSFNNSSATTSDALFGSGILLKIEGMRSPRDHLRDGKGSLRKYPNNPNNPLSTGATAAAVGAKEPLGSEMDASISMGEFGFDETAIHSNSHLGGGGGGGGGSPRSPHKKSGGGPRSPVDEWHKERDDLRMDGLKLKLSNVKAAVASNHDTSSISNLNGNFSNTSGNNVLSVGISRKVGLAPAGVLAGGSSIVFDDYSDEQDPASPTMDPPSYSITAHVSGGGVGSGVQNEPIHPGSNLRGYKKHQYDRKGLGGFDFDSQVGGGGLGKLILIDRKEILKEKPKKPFDDIRDGKSQPPVAYRVESKEKPIALVNTPMSAI